MCLLIVVLTLTKLSKSYTGTHTLLPQDIDAYKQCTKVELYTLNVPSGVKCSDPNYHNCSHYEDLDDFYNYIVGILKISGHTLVLKHIFAFKHAVVLGWNEQVKELHSAARDAGRKLSTIRTVK